MAVYTPARDARARRYEPWRLQRLVNDVAEAERLGVGAVQIERYRVYRIDARPAAGSYAFTQNTAGIPGADEAEDSFGTTVAVGDIDKDGKPELFISAAEENNATGAVWVLPSGTGGPTAKGSSIITAPSVGFPQKDSTLLGGNGLLGSI
ncbi:hypothetical protein CW362_00335 [Streptomyces populi]|uniref:Esterase n=1 Tax=Streptomyces populi TaxID=2058924 RepID=A0A2I0SYM8_9ACTN|nr:hypothetical protein CW362_00335 [Streptomyces populi]